MSRAGEILDVTEGGYHLVVCGVIWALVDLSTGNVLAQDICDNYAVACQAGLMAARVYVPDFYMAEAFTRFCMGLVDATTYEEPAFQTWFRKHHQELVNGFFNTLEGPNRGELLFKLEDLVAHARQQYDKQRSLI